MTTLFAHPTLSALSEAIVRARRTAQQPILPSISRVSRDEPILLSFAQQRLWFLAALEGESTTYHVPVVLRLRGALDVDCWRNALDAGLTEAVRRVCRRQGATVFMMMMAAWALVLSRLAGQSEVIVGMPTANRPRAELEPLIGLFVNTLAIRIDCSGEPDTAAALMRVRHAVLGAQEHQNLPFEQVVEIVQPIRRLDHTPIFQVMIAWQEVDIGPLQSPNLRVEPVAGSFDQVKFDLELDLIDDGTTINGMLRYATALFDERTAARHTAYFMTILRAMAGETTTPLTHIPLVAGEERDMLLSAWNATSRGHADPRCVHERFEAQVRSTPERVAIEFGERRIGYAQLNARANRLAHHLIGMGVRRDTPVALCVSRGIDLVVGLLAVLKAGGAYVPIDPAYPSARLEHILSDAAPAAVLVDRTTRAHITGLLSVEAPVLELDAPRPPWRSASEQNPQIESSGPSSRDLAYVVYTSGSTGTPKGVMVEHRHLCNLIDWHIRQFELQPGARTTCTAGIAFDAATWEIWPALVAGATLLLPPAGVAGDTAAMLAWWRKQRIDSAFLVTPLAMLAVEAGLPPGLRYLLIGGDRFTGLPAPLPASVQLFDNYGPTEATVVATCGAVDPNDAMRTIGRPIDNVRVYLLDSQRQLVPTGSIGEIYIGGAGVARGYLNRPDLDVERFLPDPFEIAVGKLDARMYRTGDLARYLPDGRIVFLGRDDQQVKIRGFRVELGEIETVLRAHPAISDAAVDTVDHAVDEPRLVAYFVARTDAESSEETLVRELRAHLQMRLPEYMLPAAFVALDALPLTSNGKIDRQALPAPGHEAFDRRAYEAPRGDIEIALAGIWGRLLGIERVGRQENFFTLGGHSLLAARMIGEVRATLGRDLSIRTLFEAPTIAQLSERLDSGAASDALSVLLPLRERGSRAPLFCVHPAGGFSWPYAGLLRYLPERPLFALQARGLRGARSGASIEAIASDYLAQIRAAQPEGPYHLLGWSLGCHIAHAIATQLQGQGEEVEQLIMLDGYPIPRNAASAEPSDQDIMHLLVRALSDSPPPLPNGPLALPAVKQHLVESSGGALSALGDAVIEAIFEEFKLAPALAAQFSPRTYRGDVLFFSAAKTERPETDSSFVRSPDAWQPYVDGHIDVHEIDCAHEAMMRPHALEQIGPKLADALERKSRFTGDPSKLANATTSAAASSRRRRGAIV